MNVPRIIQDQQLHLDITEAVLRVAEKHPEITYAELIHALLQVTLQWNKYAIKDERENPKT